MDKAMEDDRWRQQLVMKAALQKENGIDIHFLRQSLKHAIELNACTEYTEVTNY
jgi:hypothetical protein